MSLSAELLNLVLGDSISSEKVGDLFNDAGIGHPSNAEADVVFGFYV